MLNQFLRISVVIAFAVLACTPAYADVRADVAELMEHVRKHEVVDDSALRTAPPLELIAELKSYLADSDRRVRMAAIEQAVGVARRNLADLKVRREVTDP